MLHPTRKAVLSLALAGALSAGAFAGARAAVAGELLAPMAGGGRIELPPLDPSVPSPAAFFGRPLGEDFTRYADVRRYLAALDAASERVSISDYGTTYEDRPLTLVAITAAGNQARLDSLLARRRDLADPTALEPAARERLQRDTPIVVWLGYGIHGNEASSTEAAMATAYLLAAGRGEWDQVLEDTVVLIDPLSNPDGRERYLAGFQQRSGRRPQPDEDAAEHLEPWPGGRFNHYLIDLNRDWAWASQRETRHRLAAYRAWEPQVLADLHEMAADSTYFFPPSADPINPLIAPGLVRWLEVFGAAHGAAFDRQGWLYYNAEGFDLFYPGYGDSYPSLRGAVGMTYEVGGGGRAGLALTLPDGSLLTLADRVGRHLVASLSTVRTAHQHRAALLADFVAGRLPAPEAVPTTFYWAGESPEAEAMAAQLALHGVRVGRLAAPAPALVRPLAGGEPALRELARGTFAVTTAQPLGALAQALLAREAPIPEVYLERQRQRVEENLRAEFFDITAWSLPLAFNVEVWTADGETPPVAPYAGPPLDAERALPALSGGRVTGRGDLGFLVPPQGVAGARAVARLMAGGVRLRQALAEVTVEGERFAAGTVLAPRLGNPPDLDERIAEAVAEAGIEARRVASSATAAGLSLGSERFVAGALGKVGLLGGPGVSPPSFGYLWHLLDRQIELPVVRLDLDVLERLDLGAYDALLLPDGDYGERLTKKHAEQIETWIRTGGVLVAVGGAIDWLQQHGLTAIEDRRSPDEEGDDELPPGRELATPGAILGTRLRAGHPLAAGLPGAPPVLFEGSVVLAPTGDPQQDVLVADPDAPVAAGVVWTEERERLAGSLLVATERKGRGRLILFAQDPAFRLFWRGTVPLLVNAVLWAPRWEAGGKY